MEKSIETAFRTVENLNINTEHARALNSLLHDRITVSVEENTELIALCNAIGGFLKEIETLGEQLERELLKVKQNEWILCKVNDG